MHMGMYLNNLGTGNELNGYVFSHAVNLIKRNNKIIRKDPLFLKRSLYGRKQRIYDG